MGVTFAEAAEHLREVLEDVNIVAGAAVAGAGHNRQKMHQVVFFRSLGLTNITEVRIPLDADPVINFFNEVYRISQSSPVLGRVIGSLLGSEALVGVIDASVERTAKPEVIKAALVVSPTYNSRKPTVFLAQHESMGTSARAFGAEYLVENVPDPWKSGELRAMTMVKTAPRHITTVADRETVEEMRRIGRNDRIVWPAGTLSNHRLMGIEGREWHPGEPLKMLIGFSGNDIFPYTKLVGQLITEEQEALRTGEIELGIHTMHHPAALKYIEGVLSSLKLGDKVRVVGANTMQEAIVSKEKMIEEMPNIDLEKAGESSLESKCGGPPKANIWGTGHEIDDLKAGMRSHRLINLLGVKPERWLGIIKNDLIRIWNEKPKLEDCWALVAAGMLFDPEYYSKIVL